MISFDTYRNVKAFKPNVITRNSICKKYSQTGTKSTVSVKQGKQIQILRSTLVANTVLYTRATKFPTQSHVAEQNGTYFQAILHKNSC